MPIHHDLTIEATGQVFITQHKLVAVEVQAQTKTSRDAIILKQIVDAQHKQCIEARVEIDGRGATFKLLVRSIQEAKVGLRDDFVDGILHPIATAHRNIKFFFLRQRILSQTV